MYPSTAHVWKTTPEPCPGDSMPIMMPPWALVALLALAVLISSSSQLPGLISLQVGDDLLVRFFRGGKNTPPWLLST